MKRGSYQRGLLRSFLLAGMVPLMVCAALILGIFQTYAQSTADFTGRSQTEAMNKAAGAFMDECAEVLRQTAQNPAVRAATIGLAPDSTKVYNALYSADSALRTGANVSLYNAGGELLHTTGSAQPGETLPVDWGVLHLADAHDGTVFRRVSEYDSVRRSAMQAACPIRFSAHTVGYLVIDVTDSAFASLFESWSGEADILLLDPFWDEVYATPGIRGEDVAALLRAGLLSADARVDGGPEKKIYLAGEERSGFTLVQLRQNPLDARTLRLLYTVALLSILLCFFLCLWFSIRLSRRVSEPVRSLNRAIERVEAGDLDARLDDAGTDELGQLSGRFNRMTERLKKNISDSLRQQQELSDIQIRMMQAQLNPHFLYNTLDTLKWLGKIHKIREVSTISADLADILRRSISADEFVSLRDELTLLDRYMEIQKIRFPGKFEYRMEAEEDVLDLPIPKLMLQPLVENAVIHGFEDGSRGEIVVSAHREGDELIVSVRDNGCGMSEESRRALLSRKPQENEQGKTHLGLRNVDTILRLNYGEDHGLRLLDVPVGTCLSASIPIGTGKRGGNAS